jgi:PAS domain S-box-containing protein
MSAVTSPPLLNQLLTVTHALAGVDQVEAIFPVVLSTAQQGLMALAGAIFLPNADQTRLERMVARADRIDVPSIWQDGPIQASSPASVSFVSGKSQYFPSKGDLARAYPNLEAQTGQIAPVGSAVIPISSQNQVLGVLVLDFEEPHHFTPEEQLFLEILASLSGQVLVRLKMTAQLRHQEHLLRSIVERSPTPIAVGTKDGQVSLVNDAYLELTGLTRGAFERGEINWYTTTPPEFRAQDTQFVRQVLQNGVTPTYEKVLQRPDGERREVQLTIMRYSADSDTAILGYFVDLTAQRAVQHALERHSELLEAQVQQRTQEIQARDAELASFNLGISHDLRAPVRRIKSFAELLLRQADDLPEKARTYIDYIGLSTERMTGLLDGLLSLSQASQAPLQKAPVDLDALVKAGQTDTQLQYPEREIVWQTEPLPQVWGDAPSLERVITNLLSNAAKYSQHSAEVRIRVWSERTPEGWAIKVTDQGAGFNDEYREQLFGLFQRLHAEREFQGIGVGLATVLRIVSRHGGTVLAENNPGNGATFGFVLPDPEA